MFDDSSIEALAMLQCQNALLKEKRATLVAR